MKTSWRALTAFAILAFGSIITFPAAAQTQLSDQPLFSPLPVPGNLLLTLSVEYPTADSTAYPTSSAYNPSTTYQGYFDPAKCYTYQYNSSNIQLSYFAPNGFAKSNACTSTSTLALWSGNFLNWATMSTVDPFRWALTGGYRSALGATVKTGSSSSVAVTSGDTAPGTSTPAFTILERAWESVGQGSFGNNSGADFPDHVISGATTISDATPFQGISCLVMRSGGMGNLEYFTASVAGPSGTSPGTANACPSESGNFDSGNGDAAGSNPSGTCYGAASGSCTSTAISSNSVLAATAAATTTASGVVYYNGQTYNTSSSINISNYGGTATTTQNTYCGSPGNPNVGGTFKSGTTPTCKYNPGSGSTTVNCIGGTSKTTAGTCLVIAPSTTDSSSACAWLSSWTSSTAANLCAGTGGASGAYGSASGTIYEIAIRAQVCDPTLSGTVSANANNVESNCVAYTGSANDYKPQGLMQQYASQIDYSVFGYLNDSGDGRDGGVLRANMKFIGPQIPVPGGTPSSNPNVEWNSTTGVYIQDPGSPTNPTAGLVASGTPSSGAAASGSTPSGDATATNKACVNVSGYSGNCVTYSGVLNYINGFGETAHSYKSSDPVGELYYAGIRYYKNLGNVPNWSDFKSQDAASSSTIATYTDGFPVITTWNDPIQYACQKNFILGIGDVNTHADGDVPNNTTFIGGTYNTSWSLTAKTGGTQAESAYVNTDPVNAQVATDAVGFMESNDTSNTGNTKLTITTSNTGLGDTVTPWDGGDGDNATFDMAGLAYDAHVTDMRPNDFTQFLTSGSKTYTQTVSTFMLDVQEYQQFQYQNQFWLAAKYGGFTIPTGYSEYGSAAGAKLGTTATASPTDYSVAPAASATAFKTTTLPSLPESSWYTTTRTQLDSNGKTDLLPDNYFPASNAAAMISGLDTAFSNIVSQAKATTTAFSTVSPVVSVSDNISYSASYIPGTWVGDLVAAELCFNNSGLNPTPCTPPIGWDAQTTLGNNAAAGNGTGWKNRVIITNNNAPSNANDAVGATSAASGVLLSSLTNSASISALTTYCPDKSSTNCINFLSGDRSNEGASGNGDYRVRTSLLGDIADSQAVPVSQPNQPFSNSYNPGYSSFVSAHANRPTIVYVGANDGMLHAFDGSVSAGQNGLEYFAYMPSFGFQGPGSNSSSPGLSDSGYSATPGINGLPSYGNKAFVHHFFVDATPVVSDVDFKNTYSQGVGGSGNWHSVLIGGLGKGGAGYYALDVTDPTGADTSSPGPVAHQLTTTPGTAPTTTNANPSKVLLWEFTDSDEGFSYGEPTIVKTKQYGWVALLTSGYNNPSGVGKLYVVDVSNGNLLETISTANTLDNSKNVVIGTATSPAGLAWVSAFVSNYEDDTVDYAYAGDLFGQVWRFDLTGNPQLPSPAPSCTAAGGCPVLMATLEDSSGNRQPITTRPLIEIDPNTSNRYVLVGTGQELSASDLATTGQQAFYVIQDGTSLAPFPSVALTTGCSGTTIAAGAIPCGGILGSGLTNATSNFTTSGASSPTPVSTTSGFFINLNSGYRVVTTPTVNGDDVAFAANQPTGGVCEASGTNEAYGFAFAGALAGTSLLTNPTNGSYIPYAQNTGSAVNIDFLNVSGTTSTGSNLSTITLMVGTDVAGITTPTGNFNPTPTFKLLNWQEVNPSN